MSPSVRSSLTPKRYPLFTGCPVCPATASPGGDPIEPRAMGKITSPGTSDSWLARDRTETASSARSFGATLSLVLDRPPRRFGPLLYGLAGPHTAAREFDLSLR
jgi:hypothetical protein